MVALERQSSSASHWPELAYRRLFEQGSPARIALVIFEEGSEGGSEDKRTLSGFLVALVSGDECELEPDEDPVASEFSERVGSYPPSGVREP